MNPLHTKLRELIDIGTCQASHVHPRDKPALIWLWSQQASIAELTDVVLNPAGSDDQAQMRFDALVLAIFHRYDGDVDLSAQHLYRDVHFLYRLNAHIWRAISPYIDAHFDAVLTEIATEKRDDDDDRGDYMYEAWREPGLCDRPSLNRESAAGVQVQFDAAIPMADVRRAAESIGCEQVQRDGRLIIRRKGE